MNRQNIGNIIRNLTLVQKSLIVFGLVGLITLFIILNRPDNMEILYTNLTPEDTNAIRNELMANDIKFKVEEENKVIKVDQSQISRATAILSEKGLPQDDAVGYEIFNEANMFTNSAQQKVQYKYTTTNEIEKKIKNSFGSFVKAVELSIDFQQDEGLWEEEKIASATVNVHVKGNKTLTEEQVKSIQHMVAGNIVHLAAEDVVVTDGNGLTYDSGEKGFQGTSGYSKQQVVIDQTEKRISEDLRRTLNETLKPGNYTLNLRLKIDFDEVVRNIESVTPGQVISKEERTETTEKNEGTQVTEPGTEGSGDVPDYQETDGSSDVAYNQDKSEIIENYEVGKIIETIKQNPEVNKAMVTVTIDEAVLDETVVGNLRDKYVDTWKGLLANAAGIEMNEQGKFENGNVVVEIIDYKKRNNDVVDDAGDGSGVTDGLSEGFNFRNVAIIMVIVLLLIMLIAVFISMRKTTKREKMNLVQQQIPKAPPITTEKVVQEVVYKEPEKTFEQQEMEKEMKSVGMTEEQIQKLPNEEKMKIFNEGKAAAEMKKRYAEEVYNLADNDPQKTAEYIKVSIKQG